MTDFTLPTAAGVFVVTAEIRAGLYHKYRGVDVNKELALMHLYLAKNPARVRTLTKPIRFIETWLGKQINGGAGIRKGRSRRANAEVATPPPNNGGTALASMPAYGQTAAGSSTINGGGATSNGRAPTQAAASPIGRGSGQPAVGVITPPPLNGAPQASADDGTHALAAPPIRLHQARTLGEVLAPIKAMVERHRSTK